MRINFVVMETRSALTGLSEYLEHAHRAFTDAYTRDLDEVKRVAVEQNAPWEDYDCARQEVQGSFEIAFPDILSFSTVTLLYAILESNLKALAGQLRDRQQLALKLSDFRGDLLKRSNVYYGKVLGLPISEDPAWQDLRDLELLRHIVVHDSGTVSDSNTSVRSHLENLRSRNPLALAILERQPGAGPILKAEAAACHYYIGVVNQFFDRLFERAGLAAIEHDK